MSLISATFSTNPLTLPSHLAEANAELDGLDAEAIIAWALARKCGGASRSMNVAATMKNRA